MAFSVSKSFRVRLVPAQQVTQKLEVLRKQTSEDSDSEELSEKIMDISIEKIAKDFREALSRGTPPTLNVTICTLRNLASSHAYALCIDLFEEYKNRNGEVDNILFGEVIKACSGMNDTQTAIRLFKELELAGFKPDLIVHNYVMKMFSERGNIAEVLKWKQRICAAGFELDQFSYFLIVDVYASSRKIAKALDVLNEMQMDQVKPNNFIYNKLITGLGKAGDKRAFELYQQMEKANRNQDTFLAILEYIVKIGDRGLLKQILKQMAERNIRMNVRVMNMRFKFALSKKDFNEDKALENEMHALCIVPNTDTFYKRIYGYLVGDRWDLALNLVAKLKTSGLVINAALFKLMYAVYIKNGKFHLAEELLKDMCNAYVSPAIILSIRIHAYTVVKNLDQAEKLFFEEGKMGLLSLSNYCNMLKAYIYCGEMEKAIHLFNEMKAGAMPPDVVSFNTIIKGHLQIGQFDSAFSLLKEMQEAYELEPSHVTFFLFKEYAAGQQSDLIDKAIKAAGFCKTALTDRMSYLR